MKKLIKNKWLAALRGDKYKQGRDQLKTPQGEYCCLGVLTNLYLRSKKKSWKTKFFSKITLLAPCYEFLELPLEVQKWAGLKRSDPIVYYKEQETHCSHLNDSEQLSFKEIADIIEDEL